MSLPLHSTARPHPRQKRGLPDCHSADSAGQLFHLINLSDLTCGGFPGPGEEEHKVLVNPMAEYIHGQDEHVNVMFEKFTEKHNRKYRDFAEHGKRKMIFRDNIRQVFTPFLIE